MPVAPTAKLKITPSVKADSYRIQCFTETPGKTGDHKPMARLGAFDLFTLFTADIIRSKEIFTR